MSSPALDGGLDGGPRRRRPRADGPQPSRRSRQPLRRGWRRRRGGRGGVRAVAGLLKVWEQIRGGGERERGRRKVSSKNRVRSKEEEEEEASSLARGGRCHDCRPF
jgi:hypothetical protein